ncbi:helix-turn-helix domain-containing protein [Microbulbifer epialgicus]|uniref:Helix-turn-helix domain-containing protein n=1 Tax=Microbulbifer epialgicus TaxID=393907 RepID=A0ABV4NTS1_9GAMM
MNKNLCASTVPVPTLGEPCARHFERCELVLAAIDTIEKPSLEDLVTEIGLPHRTIHAIFKRLSDQHRVVIERVNGRRHGYYKITDWGNLDRTNIVTHVQHRKGILPHEVQKDCAQHNSAPQSV